MPWARILCLLLLVAPSLSACSLVRGRGTPPSPGRPLPTEVAAPATEAATDDAQRITASVVRTALEAVGTPYVWGGSGSNGFDCSGLIQYAYSQEGIPLPRVSTDQLRAGRRVEARASALRPGDILGFSDKAGGKSSHVGLYLGDGEFIHSSSSGVRRAHLSNPYWLQRFIAARRIVW
jgi:cell wall-associated NlpC family hydrolase